MRGRSEEGVPDAFAGEKEDGGEEELELDGGCSEDLGRGDADEGLVESEGE